MNSRSLSDLAIVGFFLLGATFIGLRYHARGEAEIARQDSLWELTYDIRFEATTTPTDPTSRPTEIRVAMPFNTPHCQVLSEEWTNAGLKARRIVWSPSGTRELQLSTTQPGIYSPQADFQLRLSPRADPSRDPGLESLSRDDRARYLSDDDGMFPTRDPVVQEAVQNLSERAGTEWEQIETLFNRCMEIQTDLEAPGGVKEALRNKRGTPTMRARAMVTVCRALGIPARMVSGFEIGQTTNASPRVWVEVFYNQRWVPFNTENGYSQTLWGNYVPVRRGGDTVIRLTEATLLPEGGERYSIRRLPTDPLVAKAETPHPLQILNLERLPVPMHTVLKILMLLPLAALITALLRNVIGLGTFGTFSPALLAMSFIYADWKTGLLILLIVVGVGLLGRSVLERLRLLMVPRLGIILTMVILCVVFTLSTLYYLFPSISAQAVLLPMVIMTMLIERFHVTIEEDGLMYAVQLALGTVLVALLCFAVLRWDRIGDWVIVYPETHFFTIALFIMLGRYAGYRLTELWRFRDLVEPGEPAR
jgi:transglutaminase-like putative cysteine protease